MKLVARRTEENMAGTPLGAVARPPLPYGRVPAEVAEITKLKDAEVSWRKPEARPEREVGRRYREFHHTCNMPQRTSQSPRGN